MFPSDRIERVCISFISEFTVVVKRLSLAHETGPAGCVVHARALHSLHNVRQHTGRVSNKHLIADYQLGMGLSHVGLSVHTACFYIWYYLDVDRIINQYFLDNNLYSHYFYTGHLLFNMSSFHRLKLNQQSIITA